MSKFAQVTSKLGNVKPETRAIAAEIYNVASGAGHEIWFMWGMGSSSEHATGRALDLMVKNKAAGDFVRNYIWENRKRLRLRHVIWWQRITSTVVQPGVVRTMADRGSVTENHKDHVHVLFNAGSYVPPISDLEPPLGTGSLIVDGILGPKTIAKWQTVMGTPVDGIISTPDSLLVRAVQKRLNETVDHRLEVNGKGLAQDGKRYKTVGALQRYLKSPVDEIMSVPVSLVVKALQRRLNGNKF